MTEIDEEALDRLLLKFTTVDFAAITAILGDAHETLDDWSESALTNSLHRLMALEQRGLIEIAGDPREPHQSKARLRSD